MRLGISRSKLTAVLLLAGMLLRGQTAEIREAPTVTMPATVDSNSPAFWRDGEFQIFNSTGIPLLSGGLDQFWFWDTQSIDAGELLHLPLWIESVWLDDDGSLYAWYHHEPVGTCPDSHLTAPQIGALVSTDGGLTFQDLGIVLSAADPPDCSAKNGFFAGGHGDFSVVLDRERRYFYFLFGSYGGPLSAQGVALARMAFEDRAKPSGAVWKRFEQGWDEPGLGGRVTPIFPAAVSWQDSGTDSFWGPSIHWNSHLNQYVVLLNRACCAPRWPQEGIYISFAADLEGNPAFTPPHKILDDIGFSPAWYPQVLGTGPGETDTLAGEVARLYIKGVSKWEIVFR